MACGLIVRRLRGIGRWQRASQLAQVTDPLGRSTSYAYDAAGRRVSVTDAAGNVTTAQSEALGRVVAAVDPLGNTTRFAYDADGWTGVMDAN